MYFYFRISYIFVLFQLLAEFVLMELEKLDL